MAERLFLYKMTSDAGGAPCVENGVLTLAICKPAIRASAVKGDWVFGVGGVNLGGRLIYVARVTKKLTDGDYYRHSCHAWRHDAIYRWKGNSLNVRSDARYHTDGSQAAKDVGHPPEHVKASVLFSEGEFRYLGKVGTPLDRPRYSGLAAVLDRLRQGHRVNHEAKVIGELLRLRDETWKAYPPGFAGEPSQPVPKRDGVCSRGERRGACA